MQHSRWYKIWKDKDFIILSCKPFDETRFKDGMNAAIFKLCGMPKDTIFNRDFLEFIGENNGRGKTRRKGTT